eukprot:superscaffoldBa00001857_g12283
MRCVSVCVRGEWFRVPCGSPSGSVQLLGSEALRRYHQAKKLEDADEKLEFSMLRCRSGELLHPEDRTEDVLEHNDFVQLVFAAENGKHDYSPLATAVQHSYQEPKEYISLDGNSLTTADLVSLGQGLFKIKLTPEAEERVIKGREVIDAFIRENRVAYGVNTGFGKFARTLIPKEQLVQLQENVVRSHCAGVGAPLSVERTRMLLVLRINVLAKGHSGISMETLDAMIKAFNVSCLSWVPEKGTVGASGDLAPLAHLTLGLLGEGRMWSIQSGWADAKAVLEGHGLKPLVLKPKEGIALINGTQLMSSLGAEAVERAVGVARQADVIAALSLEALKGSTKAFHRGWQGFTIYKITYKTLVLYESSTQLQLVFAETGETISGGNFHGEYPAKALDYLAIGVHELASISERRIERLVNPALSELPAFLVKDGGLNSGFMIAHCTAAALVSESKALCHPSSVDSLSTSAATEDHVSMGGWAARKALRVVEHVEQVLAIELLAACQALEFLRPLKSTTPLEKVYELLRSVVSPWDRDRVMSPDIEAAHSLLRQQKVWKTVQPYMDEYRKKLQA